MVSLNSNLFHSRPSVWRSVKVVLISVDRVRIPIYLSSHTHANLSYLTHSGFRFCCFGWPSDSPQWIRGPNDDDDTAYCLSSQPDLNLNFLSHLFRLTIPSLWLTKWRAFPNNDLRPMKDYLTRAIALFYAVTSVWHPSSFISFESGYYSIWTMPPRFL